MSEGKRGALLRSSLRRSRRFGTWPSRLRQHPDRGVSRSAPEGERADRADALMPVEVRELTPQPIPKRPSWLPFRLRFDYEGDAPVFRLQLWRNGAYAELRSTSPEYIAKRGLATWRRLGERS